MLTVSQAAAQLGVSRQSIHTRIARGSLPATRQGDQYFIDPVDLANVSRRSGRPLSPRSAWANLVVASPEFEEVRNRFAPPVWSAARSRFRDFAVELDGLLARDEDAVADEALDQVRHLFGARAQRRVFDVGFRDYQRLVDDADCIVQPTRHPQITDLEPRVNEVEGYVNRNDLIAVMAEYLLEDATGPNMPSVPARRMFPRMFDRLVILHVLPDGLEDLLPYADPLLLEAADLAEAAGPREELAAVALLREFAARRAGEFR